MKAFANPNLVNTERLDKADSELAAALRSAAHSPEAIKEAVIGRKRSDVTLACELLFSQNPHNIEVIHSVGRVTGYNGPSRFFVTKVLSEENRYSDTLVKSAKELEKTLDAPKQSRRKNAEIDQE